MMPISSYLENVFSGAVSAVVLENLDSCICDNTSLGSLVWPYISVAQKFFKRVCYLQLEVCYGWVLANSLRCPQDVFPTVLVPCVWILFDYASLFSNNTFLCILLSAPPL